VVGEETGGMSVHFGDVLGYKLPVSKMLCSVSYKRFWQMNADENDIHGTLPDVAVPASEAMEAAMKLVKGN
ncbi:MAG: peptidase S41, partial [Duncaniella sp.]|nr:peptidase S41 [Duncaniella sp.]